MACLIISTSLPYLSGSDVCSVSSNGIFYLLSMPGQLVSTGWHDVLGKRSRHKYSFGNTAVSVAGGEPSTSCGWGAHASGL